MLQERKVQGIFVRVFMWVEQFSFLMKKRIVPKAFEVSLFVTRKFVKGKT